MTTRLWIDQRNFVSVKGETVDSLNAEQFQWAHSDFHTIKGEWEYPFTTKMYEGDSLAAIITVTTLEFNQGLSDSLFDPDQVHVQPLELEQLMQMLGADTSAIDSGADSTR